MPSEIRRIVFFHSEIFQALTSYGTNHGHSFIGDKVVNARLASQSEYDFHTQKEFHSEISDEYNVGDMKNAVIVTFFDETTFEHKYYSLPPHFISEALIEFSIANKIPLPKKSKKKLDVTEFNICLDIVLDDEQSGKLELVLEDD